MDSDLLISSRGEGEVEVEVEVEVGGSGKSKKRKQLAAMDSVVETSVWESAPPMFPLVAVMPRPLTLQEEYFEEFIHGTVPPYRLNFIGFEKSGKQYTEHQTNMPHKDISLLPRLMSNKDGWFVFLLLDDSVVIWNPDNRIREYLPSVYPFLPPPPPKYHCAVDQVYLLLLPDGDTRVAFATASRINTTRDLTLATDAFATPFRSNTTRDLTLATASPGDNAWSVLELPYLENRFHSITDIVFHEADGKFYAMDFKGHLLPFRLARCGRTTAAAAAAAAPAAATTTTTAAAAAPAAAAAATTTTTRVVRSPSVLGISISEESKHIMYGRPHLFSDGTNLLQVRRRSLSRGDYKMSKYHFVEDRWIAMTNVDLGDNSLFIDYYGAKLLPCPSSCPAPPPIDKEYGQEEEEEERMMMMRRNCIYFFDFERAPPTPAQLEREEELAKYEEEVKLELEGEGLIYVSSDFDESERDQLFVPRGRIYDFSTGIVETCFITDIQSQHVDTPTLMWFMPRSSINN